MNLLARFGSLQSDTTNETLEEYKEVLGYLSGFGLGIADLNRLKMALKNGERYIILTLIR